ncbi:MAG: DEAD/DEAH box helicase family protein [Cyanobacteria bacterium REEB459]|nr:DEAD/DEAH box helicase family protein [Cyanobacteria bacterium REEB459]
MQTTPVTHSGEIKVASGNNPRQLYPHQSEAIKALDEKNQSTFEGLLVLPTGSGKTLTTIHWLLRSFISRRKKVLWVAHRHELLNQACETLKLNAYENLLKDVESFRFRVISGHREHDRPVNIEPSDDIIIASKDSLNGGLHHLLEKWVKHTDEILLVIDEAHHATAKTYRKLITAIKQNFEDRKKVMGFRMLGLTATPFRTRDDEKSLLKKVFPDDIIFSEHLRKLITKGILSEPIFISLDTQQRLYGELTQKDIKTIEDFDKLPKKIAEKIASSKLRNKLIVDHYIEKRQKYKPLLVFAIDVNHAIALNKLFQDRGVNSDFIVSSMVDGESKSMGPRDNVEIIRRFRAGELEVLINVEMLTEGTDLPTVQTVFLTRPTISIILMTQMIGRALRGKAAGGTDRAYVVSFIDNWENKINWVNPEKLIEMEGIDPIEKGVDTTRNIIRVISIDLLEEFTRIMDDSIDTTEIERIDFLKRIPIGIYRFSILEPSESGEPRSRNYDVLIYSDIEESYDNFVNDLGAIFKGVDIQDREILTDEELEKLLESTKELYFLNHSTLLGYRDEDIKNILRFYAQKEAEPDFIPFSERRKCDISILARYIKNNNLTNDEQLNYLESAWNDDKTFWKILYDDNRKYFKSQIDIELNKLNGWYPGLTIPAPPVVIIDEVPLEKLSLFEIRDRDSAVYRNLKDAVFEKHTDAAGFITCAATGRKSHMRRDFQIDHIIPMAEGGLTKLDNLQVLCHPAHIEKSRRETMARHRR